MRIIFAAAILLLMTGSGFAQAPSCKATSAEKHLSGAAQKSFMDKCQRDAAQRCDDEAAAKKLSGAAKTSFTKKCVADGVGA